MRQSGKALILSKKRVELTRSNSIANRGDEKRSDNYELLPIPLLILMSPQKVIPSCLLLLSMLAVPSRDGTGCRRVEWILCFLKGSREEISTPSSGRRRDRREVLRCYSQTTMALLILILPSLSQDLSPPHDILKIIA